MDGPRGGDRRGKERFERELEEFAAANLAPFPGRCRSCGGGECGEAYPGPESCPWRLERRDGGYRKDWEGPGGPLRLTNHEICHELFWNAFSGRSKLYIEMRDLRSGRAPFYKEEGGAEEGTMTLSCSLASEQMLEYDAMMFEAMGNREDEDYSRAAREHYRPYLFSYVAEIGRESYEELRELQTELAGPAEEGEDAYSPYLWLECTFAPDAPGPYVKLAGYAVQSASPIDKPKAALKLLKGGKRPRMTRKEAFEKYAPQRAYAKGDSGFRQVAGRALGSVLLERIDIYRIGNGNCVYAQDGSGGTGFFFDVGYNYMHKLKKLRPGVSYAYSPRDGGDREKRPGLRHPVPLGHGPRSRVHRFG